MEKVFVITWGYSDGQTGGVVRVYSSKETAEAELKLFIALADSKIFMLGEVEIID